LDRCYLLRDESDKLPEVKAFEHSFCHNKSLKGCFLCSTKFNATEVQQLSFSEKNKLEMTQIVRLVFQRTLLIRNMTFRPRNFIISLLSLKTISVAISIAKSSHHLHPKELALYAVLRPFFLRQ
jgi:hypothetical protein